MAPRRFWTAEERFYLRTHYGRRPTKRIAASIDRSVVAVDCEAAKLGLRRKRPWTDAERDFIRRHYRQLTFVEIGRRLNRAEKAVRHEAHRLGWFRRRSPIAWTAERVAFLEDHYAEMTPQQVADELGVPLRSVYDKACQLGLRKTSALTAEAEAVLWELRDQEGIEEYLSAELGVGLPAIQRTLAKLRGSGGPARAVGNLGLPPSSGS